MSEAIDYTQSDVPVPTPAYKVFHAPTWEDAWEEAPNVDLLRIEDGIGKIASIVLAYTPGKILRESADEYATETPLDWAGHFVMVEWYGQDDAGAPTDDVAERWIGKMMLEDREVLGADADGVGAVNQKLLVRGLEHLLDEVIVTGSWIASRKLDGTGDMDTPVAVHVDRPMIFNAPRNGPVPWDRNCSNAVVSQWYAPGATSLSSVPQNHDGGSGPSVFVEIGDDTTTWKIGDILDYLVCLYGPDLGGGSRFRTATVEPGGADSSDAVGDALYDMVAPPFRVEGKSLFQCLNQLLRPERGLGWKLVYDQQNADGEAGPIIFVFSIQANDITVDDVDFPGATNVVTIDLRDRRDATWQSRQDVSEQYGKILVRGEELLTCFSISDADGSLTKGWKTEEETAYANPPDVGSAGADDYEEKVLKYRARSRVWSEFVLKDDWNLKAKNGAGAGTATAVNPLIEPLGTLDYTKQTSMSTWDKRFERFIPIEVDKPAEAVADPKPKYQEPIAFIKEPYAETESWIDLVNNLNPKMPRVSHYEPLEDRPGFKIRCDPNHLLAGGVVEGEESEDAADWTDMILTVAMRTGTRISLLKTVDSAADPNRVLLIDVDHAEMWVILANTVKSVKADGTLVRVDETTTVRDDMKRLKVVRDLASGWYGQYRHPVSVQFRSLTVQVPNGADTITLTLGRFVERLEEDGGFGVDARTVITERAFDFVNNTSKYETGYGFRPQFDNIA